jgi:hypothetical protein
MSRKRTLKEIPPDKLKFELVDDAITLKKLEALKTPDLDTPEPSASLLERVAPEKRDEVVKVLRSQNARMRAYLAGESDGSDW